MSQTELRITEDGSHTLYLPDIDECYHSSHGAIQESQLIFIEYGLCECKKDVVNILEIGFGTGLNCFLSMIEAEKTKKKIRYTALELFPLDTEKALSLNFPEALNFNHRDTYEMLHTSEWNKEISISTYVDFIKIKADFTQFAFTQYFDVIYFDAFSPEKQPEMWTEEMFKKLYNASNSDALLTTYCCKGDVKRALKSAGFTIEKLAGPIGKREVLRAKKHNQSVF